MREKNEFDVYLGDGSIHPETLKMLQDRPVLFEEKGSYLADEDLIEAVNIALCVSQPLLVTGEPGCGKTRLAWSIATELGLGEPLTFYTRSTSKSLDLLYYFDSVLRFHDIQSGSSRAEDPRNYIRFEALGEAIVSGERRVVLIDEIDKAPRDFPNDLLTELERMTFRVKEVRGPDETTAMRPIVIITSNSERQLPLPFLRRVVFHHIGFPDEAKLAQIIHQRLGDCDLDGGLIRAAVEKFQQVREIPGLIKKPATGELLAWTLALHMKRIAIDQVKRARLSVLPLWQTLLKDRDDYRRLQQAT